MISGNSEKKISKYLPIDRLGKGCGYVLPSENEELVGIPYQWLSENSMPFIEHRIDGVMVKTVNAIELAEIEFEEKK